MAQSGQKLLEVHYKEDPIFFKNKCLQLSLNLEEKERTSFEGSVHIESHPWPFKDIGFLILHTQNKLATHEHLKQVIYIEGSVPHLHPIEKKEFVDSYFLNQSHMKQLNEIWKNEISRSKNRIYPYPFLSDNESDIESLIRLGRENAENFLFEYGVSVQQLKESAEKVLWGIQESNWLEFKRGLKSFKKSLQDRGFVCLHSLNLLRALENIAGVEIAKACGAFGSDTILLFLKNPTKKKLEEN